MYSSILKIAQLAFLIVETRYRFTKTKMVMLSAP